MIPQETLDRFLAAFKKRAEKEPERFKKVETVAGGPWLIVDNLYSSSADELTFDFLFAVAEACGTVVWVEPEMDYEIYEEPILGWVGVWREAITKHYTNLMPDPLTALCEAVTAVLEKGEKG